MKIGIQKRAGGFSDRWISYCESKGIAYKLVDCYRNDIIEQLSDCEALMWNLYHKGARESKFAKQLLFAVQASGKKVFPDFNSVWHFDDKVAQKYLLESLGVPLAPSYVFYTRREALQWVEDTSYPKVFKLRNGASSDNVKLVRSRRVAERLINKAFGRGFKQYKGWNKLKERYRKYRLGKLNFLQLLKGFLRLFWPTRYGRLIDREKGYVYFQDFIAGNDHDIRVVVIGDRAFAIKRMVRENDFRASGSGFIVYEKKHFDDEVIKLAFDISAKVKDQCMAYDFVFQDGKPLVVEISYGFAIVGYDPCEGFWDREMNWHEGKFDPFGWMVDDLMEIN